MAETDTGPSLDDLLAKGEGVLSKRGNVWTYPGCLNDTSGTNLVLPLEYVTDVDVQKALSDGKLSAAVITPAGYVSSVRLASEGVAVVQAGLAGSAEMGTELPPNSRVASDAGAGVTKPADAERQVIDGLKAATNKPPEAAPAALPVEPAQPELEGDTAAARRARR
jgi:hypothetical protein